MTKQELIAAAEAQHTNHPQYKGHWDGDEWFVALCTRRVETSAGLAFDAGDVTLAKLDEDSRVGNDVMWLTAYSFRTGMDTAVEADAFDGTLDTNAGGPAESPNALPPVGTHVRLRHDVDRYPHFIVDAGSTGVVTTSDGSPDGLFSVRMDDPIRNPSGRVVTDWDNEVQWVPDTGDDPLRDIEVIPARKLVATFDVSLLTEAEVGALSGYVEAQAESNRGDGAEVTYPSVGVEVEVEPPFSAPQERPMSALVALDDLLSHGAEVLQGEPDEGGLISQEAHLALIALRDDLARREPTTPTLRTVEVLVTVEIPADAPATTADIVDEVRGALEVGTDTDMTPALMTAVLGIVGKEVTA